MLKKLLSFLAVLTLVAGLLAACSGDDETSSNKNENGNNNNGEEGNNGGSDEPVKITAMYTLHTPETPGDYILDQIEEATNTELDIQWIPDGNYEERLNTAFATNTLPQVTMIGNTTMYNQFKEAIRADQFWEIGPYLEEFPNLSKLKPEIIENTKVDGKVYALYQGRPLSRQGLIYRKDWADNLGISAPTNVDELKDMLQAFTEEDPDGNGKDDTIGLTDRSDLVYGAFKTVSSWFGTPNYWGEKDGELLPEFMFDEYVATMDYIKEIRANGWMNQDFPVTSKSDQQDMIKNGTAGAYIGSMADVISIYNDAKELNPDVEYDVQNVIEGPDGEFGVWAIPGYGSVLLFSKNAIETEDELKDILGFYDKLMSTEVANLLVWGEEGIHYKTVEGGIELLEENRQRIDTEVRPLLAMEIGEPETSGRYEMISTYETKAKAEELIKDNNKYLIHDPTNTLESETMIQDGERLKQIITDATYNYMLGEIDLDGFNKQVEKWKNEGGDQVIKEYNEAYSALQ